MQLVKIIFRTLLGLMSMSLTTLSGLDVSVNDDVTSENDGDIPDLLFQTSADETDFIVSFKDGATWSVHFPGLWSDVCVSDLSTFFRFRFLAIFSKKAAAEIGTINISLSSISGIRR